MSSSTSPCHPLQAQVITTSPPHHYKPLSSSSSISSCGLLQVHAILYKPILSLQALVIPYKPNSSLQISMPSSPSPPHHYKPRSSPQAHLITTSPGHHHNPISSLQAQVITTSPSHHYKPRSSPQAHLFTTSPGHPLHTHFTLILNNLPRHLQIHLTLVLCKPALFFASPLHHLRLQAQITSSWHFLSRQAHAILFFSNPVLLHMPILSFLSANQFHALISAAGPFHQPMSVFYSVSPFRYSMTFLGHTNPFQKPMTLFLCEPIF